MRRCRSLLASACVVVGVLGGGAVGSAGCPGELQLCNSDADCFNGAWCRGGACTDAADLLAPPTRGDVDLGAPQEEQEQEPEPEPPPPGDAVPDDAVDDGDGTETPPAPPAQEEPPPADAEPPVDEPPPAAVPLEHDEDGDGVVDDVDNCPGIANAAQLDEGEVLAGRSADGVGDACDPRPNDEGEAILFFDAFAGATLSAAWSVSGSGTWVVAGDALMQTDAGLVDDTHASVAMAEQNYSVETRARIDVVNGDPAVAMAEVRGDVWNGAFDGYACAARAVGAGGDWRLQRFDDGATTGLQTLLAITGVVDVPLALSSSTFGTRLSCRISNGPERVQLSANDGSVGGDADNGAGVGVFQAAATFEYVVVYRVGGVVF